LKLIWASLPFRGLERASQAFPNGGFFRVIKREDPAGQKIACPDSRSKDILCLSALKKNSLPISFSKFQ